MEALKKLVNTPLQEIGTQYVSGAVVVVSADDTVAATCSVLDGAKVSSAVVYDYEKNAVLGLVDMLDIVAHLVASFPKEEELKENISKALGISSFVFAGEAIRFIINKSFVDAYVPLPKDCKLIHALEPLANGGLPRVPIVETPREGDPVEKAWDPATKAPVVKVLSQWAVIDFLVQHRAKLAHGFFLEPLEVLKDRLLQDTPLLVDTHIRAIDAFKLIDATKRNALVMIDDNNEPIRNLSANDLKVLLSEDVSSLLLPLPEFLSKLSAHTEAKPSRGVIGVTLNTTLIDAMAMIVQNRVHRLWVFGPDSKTIIAVLSLTNILKEVLRHL